MSAAVSNYLNIFQIYVAAKTCAAIYIKHIEKKQMDKKWCKNKAMITAKNITVQSVNQTVGLKLTAETVTCSSTDMRYSDLNGEDGSQYLAGMVAILKTESIFLDKSLTLRIGFLVLLLSTYRPCQWL